jgi:hypothetical protein
MKTKINQILSGSSMMLISGLVIISSLCSCSSDDKGRSDNKENVSVNKAQPLTACQEDQLNLTKHPVDDGVATGEFTACDQNVGINILGVNKKIPRLAEEIENGAFKALRDSAAAHVPTTCPNYITAIKITYGLHTTLLKMDLLYTPVYMIKVRDSTSGAENWRIYDVVDDGSYYTYNTTNNTFAKTIITNCISRYSNNVKIDRDRDGDKEDFDPSLDVNSVIFSFQEIDSVIAQNPSTQSVKIFNASVNASSGGTPNMKHSLLLGPDSKNPALVRVYFDSFYGKYGNLGHLCPPSCVRLRYQVQ